VVRQFVQERFGWVLSCSSCWNYLRRLGFVLKRPKKRLSKANAEKRDAFVALMWPCERKHRCAALRSSLLTRRTFALTSNCVPSGCCAVNPRWWTQAVPSMARRPPTTRRLLGDRRGGGVVGPGNTNAATSVLFLQQLRARHPEPLIVIWDNGPAHHGPEIRAYLTTPELNLRLVALPGYSPDFNPTKPSGTGFVKT